MRKHNSLRPHTTTTRRAREHVDGEAPARPPGQRLIADAVIAGYIHDISRGSRRGARASGAPGSRIRIAD